METSLKKVPLKDIVVLDDRGRKNFGKIQELAASIKANGIISPLYVKPHTDGKYALVAGERRYRASIVAGLAEVPVQLASDLNPLQAKIVELEENIARVDLDWQEQAQLHADIDELKKRHDPSWTQKKTAELANLSPSMISRQIAIANELKANPELRKKVGKLDFNSADKVIKNHHKVEQVTRLQEQGKLVVTSDLRHGKAEELIKKLPSASVDLLLTDPPYGLEALEDLREGTGTKMPGYTLMSETHNMKIEDVLAFLRTMAPELVRVLKPGAHAYVFCAFQYIGDFARALSPLEFQPPTLIWKRNKPTGPGFGYNYLNYTEAIIMFHNPPREKRLTANKANVLEHPEVPKTLRVYPTEKPLSLLKELITMSTNLGDTVLDICAGSGSTLQAAKELGRKSLGFECNEDSWKIAQFRLAGVMKDQKELFEGQKA